MTKATLSFERIRAEHLELRRRVARLQQRLDGGAEVLAGREVDRRWASGVAEDLLRLHEETIVHFAEEETSGFFEELTAEFPERARQLQALAAQHAEILADGRGIASEFAGLAETGAGSPTDLVRRARRLLDRLLRHEQEETALMQRAYTEDLGTP